MATVLVADQIAVRVVHQRRAGPGARGDKSVVLVAIRVKVFEDVDKVLKFNVHIKAAKLGCTRYRAATMVCLRLQ